MINDIGSDTLAIKGIPKVIGFTGRAGVGKTTCAAALSQALKAHIDSALAVIVCPFSAPLKRFALDMGWNGVKDDKGRRLLQLLGTEVGRECIHEDIWVSKWLEHTNAWRRAGCLVIADDIRFNNEARAVRDLGGWVFEIVAPAREINLGSLGEHKSEAGISYNLIDYQLDTSGTEVKDLPRVFGEVIEARWLKEV